MRNLRLLTLALSATGLLACGGNSTPAAPSASHPAPTVSGGPFDLLFTGLAQPHAGQRIYVAVIRDRDRSVIERSSQTIAQDGMFGFSWEAILEANQSYHLDFYADHNGNGTCDPPPDDHTWQESLGTVSGPVTHDFNHHANFVDVCPSFQ